MPNFEKQSLFCLTFSNVVIFLFISTLFLSSFDLQLFPEESSNVTLSIRINTLNKTKYELECFKKPSEITNLSLKVKYHWMDHLEYTRCILSHGTHKSLNEQTIGIPLIVDSQCPLGIEVARQFRMKDIDHLDIRGPHYLNLTTDAGRTVLDQFRISKALILCDTPMSRAFKTKIPIVSAVDSISGRTQIKLPKVFGHMRGKKSKDKLENLFFQCIEKDVQIIDDDANYVLAPQAAKFVIDNYMKDGTFKMDATLMTGREISSLFQKHCNLDSKVPLVESLMETCEAFPMQSIRPLRLSIVTIATTDMSVLKRASQTFYFFEHYLSKYHFLPLEFIIVSVDINNKKIEEELKLGPNTRKYTRILKLPVREYKDLISKLNITFFPEYYFRNAGIRRANGEYVLSMSVDSFPNKALFDHVLYGQFTPHSYMRAKKEQNKMELEKAIKIMDDEVYPYNQYFMTSHSASRDMCEYVLCHGGGEMQILHWKSWEIIHGYYEGRGVLHVDTFFSSEVIAHLAGPTLMKIIGNSYHYFHISTSHQKTPLTNNRNSSKYLPCGYISADTFHPRENWGFKDKEMIEFHL